MLGEPQSARLRSSADCDAMTGTLRTAGLALGKADTNMELTDGSWQAAIPHHIRGKKMVLTG